MNSLPLVWAAARSWRSRCCWRGSGAVATVAGAVGHVAVSVGQVTAVAGRIHAVVIIVAGIGTTAMTGRIVVIIVGNGVVGDHSAGAVITIHVGGLRLSLCSDGHTRSGYSGYAGHEGSSIQCLAV